MGTRNYVTFDAGERDVEAVAAEVREAVRKLRENDETLPDGEPDIREHRDSVVWHRSRRFSELEPVDVPRAVRTADTEGGGSEVGRLFLRLGDRLPEVDVVEASWYAERYVVDYVRINYGLVPQSGYARTDGAETTARDDADADWDAVLSVDAGDDLPVEPARVGRWVDGWNDAEVERPDRETIVDLLAVDPYYHPLRSVLATLEGEPPTAAFDRLDHGDPDVRARAVRRIAAAGSVPHWREPDVETAQYVRFLEALETVDARTRALVAPTLWQPVALDGDEPAAPSLVPALAALLEDDVPELRAAGLAGASAALGRLLRALEDGELDPESDGVDDALESFYDAYEAALTDDDVRVRERALAMAREMLPPGNEYVFEVWDRLPFRRRWEIATTYAATAAATELGTRDDGARALACAFDGEPAAVPALVEYAYDGSNPYTEAVRAEMASFAADRPEAALPALEPAVAAVAGGTETVADVELLAELATERPDEVAAVTDELVAMLDSERDAGEAADTDGEPTADEKRRAAARALDRLPEAVVPVGKTELLEATTDVFDDDGRLVVDRMGALASVSPGEAAAVVADLLDETGPDGREYLERRHVERSLRAMSDANADAVVEALPAVEPLFDDPAGASKSLPVALARTAVDRPDAVADYADAVASFLGHPYWFVREGAAAALVAVGRGEPDALAPPLDALLERGDDALAADELVDAIHDSGAETPPDWPLGVVAAADPAFAVDAVETFVPDRKLYGDEGALVLELAAGDRRAAVETVELLLDRGELPKRISAPLEAIADERPAVVANVVEPIVDVLAAFDAETDRDVSFGMHPTEEARPLEYALAAATAVEPATVRAALEARYPSVDAFIEAFPTEHREAIGRRLDGER